VAISTAQTQKHFFPNNTYRFENRSAITIIMLTSTLPAALPTVDGEGKGGVEGLPAALPTVDGEGKGGDEGKPASPRLETPLRPRKPMPKVQVSDGKLQTYFMYPSEHEAKVRQSAIDELFYSNDGLIVTTTPPQKRRVVGPPLMDSDVKPKEKRIRVQRYQVRAEAFDGPSGAASVTVVGTWEV